MVIIASIMYYTERGRFACACDPAGLNHMTHRSCGLGVLPGTQNADSRFPCHLLVEIVLEAGKPQAAGYPSLCQLKRSRSEAVESPAFA